VGLFDVKRLQEAIDTDDARSIGVMAAKNVYDDDNGWDVSNPLIILAQFMAPPFFVSNE